MCGGPWRVAFGMDSVWCEMSCVRLFTGCRVVKPSSSQNCCIDGTALGNLICTLCNGCHAGCNEGHDDEDGGDRRGKHFGRRIQLE